MLLRTLINGLVDGSKLIIYNNHGNLIFAGTKEQTYGGVAVNYGRSRVKHFGPCYNKEDGCYISITLKD